MKKSLTTLATLLTTAGMLTACGSGGTSGPSYADVAKDQSSVTAQKACVGALGDDQSKLGLLDPGDPISGDEKYKIAGVWMTSLDCTITGPSFHNTVTFSNNSWDNPNDLQSHQGGVYAWVGSDSGTAFAPKAQAFLDEVTKKLAG